MTHSVLLMATDVATRCRIPLRLVCSAMGISNSNARRWLSRLRNGEPLINQRGPKVFTSTDMDEAIRFDLRSLQHGYRRSYGTQVIYQKYRGNISMRSLDKLVKQTRRDAISVSRKNNKQVSWYGSGLVWAMDDTEVTRNAENGKITLHQIRDLASRYVLPPIESKNVPDEKKVAENLDQLFKRHGAPLFVKRDNAGNFNNPSVDTVLAKYGAMPLNSPSAYPKYNGAEERGQGELKTELKRHLAGVDGWTLDTIAPFAHAAANDLNHMNRKTLKGSHACHIHATTRITFTLNERKAIYAWIMKRRDIILESGSKCISPEAAWRAAAVQWLSKNRLIKITAAEKVSSSFQAGK